MRGLCDRQMEIDVARDRESISILFRTGAGVFGSPLHFKDLFVRGHRRRRFCCGRLEDAPQLEMFCTMEIVIGATANPRPGNDTT